MRNRGITVNPASNTTKELVKLEGHALFLSTEIIRQGANSDLTLVLLDIEGRKLVNISMAALLTRDLLLPILMAYTYSGVPLHLTPLLLACLTCSLLENPFR